MENKNEKKLPMPNWWQILIVLGGFLALAFGFTAVGLPIQLALLGGWFLALAVGKIIGYSYPEMQKFILDGINNGLEAVLILLAVGALIGTWVSGGIVPGIVYYGLRLISPSIFLFAALIITSITSISTGTSWGSIGTAGIAMMGVGAGLGIDPALTAGAIISGAYIGDKVSPLSDSTILSASMSRVELIDHIRGMMPVTLPAFLISGAGYLVAGFVLVDPEAGDPTQIEVILNGLTTTFNMNLLVLLPIIIVIVLLAMGYPSMPVIYLGAGLGILWGIFFQGLAPIEAVSTAWTQLPMETGVDTIDGILAQGGIASMLESVAVIILGLGFAGILQGTKILQAIANQLDRFIVSLGTLNLVTLIVGFFGQLFGSALYVSAILTPSIMGAKYDEHGVDRTVLSRNTEVSGTLVSAMIPWTDNGIYVATILGVSVFEYLPFMWFALASIVITIIFGFADIAMPRADEGPTGRQTAQR